MMLLSKPSFTFPTINQGCTALLVPHTAWGLSNGGLHGEAAGGAGKATAASVGATGIHQGRIDGLKPTVVQTSPQDTPKAKENSRICWFRFHHLRVLTLESRREISLPNTTKITVCTCVWFCRVCGWERIKPSHKMVNLTSTGTVYRCRDAGNQSTIPSLTGTEQPQPEPPGWLSVEILLE